MDEIEKIFVWDTSSAPSKSANVKAKKYDNDKYSTN